MIENLDLLSPNYGIKNLQFPIVVQKLVALKQGKSKLSGKVRD